MITFLYAARTHRSGQGPKQTDECLGVRSALSTCGLLELVLRWTGVDQGIAPTYRRSGLAVRDVNVGWTGIPMRKLLFH